jgi:hypothetical protein
MRVWEIVFVLSGIRSRYPLSDVMRNGRYLRDTSKLFRVLGYNQLAAMPLAGPSLLKLTTFTNESPAAPGASFRKLAMLVNES